MSITIDLTPSEEAQLSEAAQKSGMAPSDLLRKLPKDYLPAVSGTNEDELSSLLRRLQEQDGTKLFPDVPAQTLFAQWAEEDAKMTDEEREAEDRLWEELEEVLVHNNRVLEFRQPS